MEDPMNTVSVRIKSTIKNSSASSSEQTQSKQHLSYNKASTPDTHIVIQVKLVNNNFDILQNENSHIVFATEDLEPFWLWSKQTYNDLPRLNADSYECPDT